MSASPAPLRRLVLVLALLPACEQKGSTSGSIAKALETPAKAEAKSDAKSDGKAKAKPAPDPNAPPWTPAQVKSAIAAGTKLAYARSGTDAKGKKVGGTLTYVVAKIGDDGPVTSYTIDPDPGTNAASSQLATVPWSNLSPLFAMEKPTVTVSGRESVTVPAGTFECSRAQLEDFFGNSKTVWMIVDRPGIYAKVEDHGSARDEADKTEIVLELTALP